MTPGAVPCATGRARPSGGTRRSTPCSKSPSGLVVIGRSSTVGSATRRRRELEGVLDVGCSRCAKGCCSNCAELFVYLPHGPCPPPVLPRSPHPRRRAPYRCGCARRHLKLGASGIRTRYVRYRAVRYRRLGETLVGAAA